jgi:drug/metabolite transporter (DMT)-like permease
LFLTKAYQLAPPSVISPFNYSSILWAVLFGLLWGHFPEWHVWLGSTIVVMSGIYIIHRERMRQEATGKGPATPVPPV